MQEEIATVYEPLTAAQVAAVAPFVTNTTGHVFALRNLPEVVKGALFSRYSRSSKGLRHVLVDEFLQNDAAGLAALANPAATADDVTAATQRAEAFYERVLIGYGDDSVAELGGAHIACEAISNVAAKVLEDSRIGLSPLEKSTRYVPFDQQVAGRYQYYREPTIMASAHAARYVQAMDGLFATYARLLPDVLAWVQQHNPRDEQTTPRAYRSATRARALDLLRGLLPMATLTNVGLYGNGRAFEYALTKLAASPHAELRQLGQQMQQELDQVLPAFVKRAKSERGAAYAAYLAACRVAVAAQAHEWLPSHPDNSTGDSTHAAPAVQLVAYDPAAEVNTVAAMLYPHSDLPLAVIREVVATWDTARREAVIAAYIGERGVRFHRPGRALEEPYYTFDLLADLGAYRDLQRHRMLTQERQPYGVQHGSVTPPELVAAGVADAYRAALETAADAVEAIRADLPDAAQYAVPFAFRVRWRVTINLRAAYHLCELRSSRQGHPAYRAVAQAMYRQIAAVHPALAAGMQFVDMHDYDLERLAAEQRQDAKAARLGRDDC